MPSTINRFIQPLPNATEAWRTKGIARPVVQSLDKGAVCPVCWQGEENTLKTLLRQGIHQYATPRLCDTSEFSWHAIWAERHGKGRKKPLYLRQRPSLAISPIAGARDKPHCGGSGSRLLRAEGGWPGMAQGRAVQAAGCPESRSTKCLLTPSAASHICLSPRLTMLSRGDLCACPLSPCWAAVLFTQQMLVLALR